MIEYKDLVKHKNHELFVDDIHGVASIWCRDCCVKIVTVMDISIVNDKYNVDNYKIP